MQNQEKIFKRNNHASDILSVLETFQQSNIFTDVVLLCQGKCLKAHQIVLSACSPYFQTIFMATPTRHFIMTFVEAKLEDIKSILDFIYKGEVSVPHSRLSSFLKLAESLEVKGLVETCSEKHFANSISQEDGLPPTMSKDQDDVTPVFGIAASSVSYFFVLL